MAGTEVAPYTVAPTAVYQRGQRPQVLQVQQGGGSGDYTTYQGIPRNDARRYSLSFNKVSAGQVKKNPGGALRSFLSSSGTIPVAWGISMLLVGVDEWRRHGILARPARLWWTSIAFFILAILAHFDALAIIANLLAWGFVLQLAYQYFNKTGQFS